MELFLPLVVFPVLHSIKRYCLRRGFVSLFISFFVLETLNIAGDPRNCLIATVLHLGLGSTGRDETQLVAVGNIACGALG